MRLIDGTGKAAAVTLASEPALAFPAGTKGFDDGLSLDTWDNHVLLSSIRVPLAAFAGVDLSDVHSVALAFDVTDKGAIFVTDLEFLQTDMTDHTAPAAGSTKPDYVTALEAAYSAPSQAGFGSAVFYEPVRTDDDLDQAALARYRFFVGDLWDRYGEAAWMGPWKRVYTRQAGVQPDIVAELSGMDDAQARLSASAPRRGRRYRDRARRPGGRIRRSGCERDGGLYRGRRRGDGGHPHRRPARRKR